MLLEVTIQVGLLTKASITQVALKGLLLVVDVANMPLQVGRDAEGAVAVFTSARREREKKKSVLRTKQTATKNMTLELLVCVAAIISDTEPTHTYSHTQTHSPSNSTDPDMMEELVEGETELPLISSQLNKIAFFSHSISTQQIVFYPSKISRPCQVSSCKIIPED